ncbi:MAG: hypothetical protein O3A82_12020 [Verrucomicrobia bacterium]|nr:hypothetical protein [Verrucomicrobiota bacterium]MDA1047645.1 hypothetical protein [Verrucomicrobiota bacterium]
MFWRLPVPVPALLFSVLLLPATPPKLDALFPTGGQRGKTVEVKAIGSFDVWPPEVWTDHDGLKIEAKETKGLLSVSINQDAKMYPALIRLFDANGSTNARTFVISKLKEANESEPNDNTAQAQEVNATATGIVINGILKKGDSDFFRIALRQGKAFVAETNAYSLGSLIDPFLVMLGPDGHEVGFASDSHNLDPILNYTAKISGVHYLQLFAVAHPAATAIGFSGSDSATYRLTLTLGELKKKSIQADRGEEQLKDDNGSRRFQAPLTVQGTLSEKLEVDSYVFSGKKGEQWLVSVDAHRLHLPTDPVLAVYRANGALLKEVDDVKPTNDPEYLLKVSADGNYTLRIRDRFNRGGTNFCYRLNISKPKPELSVVVDKQNLVLEANGTTELKLTLNRKQGHSLPLRFAITPPLPSGVSLEDANASAKAKTAAITFRASKEAKPVNHTFQLQVFETDETNATKESLASYSFLTAKSRGDYLVNKTNHLHLTVVKAAKPKKENAEEEEKD